MILPKDEGGLGIKKAVEWSGITAAMLKHLWYRASKIDSVGEMVPHAYVEK